MLIRWISTLVALSLGTASAAAQPVADFFKGKTVTIVVSTGTGGGYDTLARGIARHIGRLIPGNPTVIVRNMPGAGGITAMNWLYNTADKDGTIIGLVGNGMPLEPLVRHQDGPIRRHEIQLARHAKLRSRHGPAVEYRAREYA